ncbi:MAG: RNA methyltransferase, partial [Saprospiraceae bacterium]|nr:RNA methyltransferase [Saprospiraceae bacterium]
MIKLHPVLVKAVVEALQIIFAENRHADKVIEQTLKSNPKWGARDRAFIAESVYDMVRHYRLLYELDGAPPASPADWYRLFGTYRLLNDLELPPWVEFEGVKKSRIADKYPALRQVRAIRESVPDWLDALGAAELGNQWEATLQALNQPAQVVLRTNVLKTNRETLIKQLL